MVTNHVSKSWDDPPSSLIHDFREFLDTLLESSSETHVFYPSLKLTALPELRYLQLANKKTPQLEVWL